MKCTKCGQDALIKFGDWYKCMNCGAEIFDTEIVTDSGISPTMAIEQLERDRKQLDNIQDADTAVENEPVPRVSNRINRKNKKKKEKKEKPKSKSQEALEFLAPIIAAFIIATILKNFVFANAQVPTGSMLNTIQEGDHIIASRLAYIADDPERYDIVIFEYPDWEIDPAYNKKTYFVKRIIGLPGEIVNITDGKVYITSPEGITTQLKDDFVTNGKPYGNYGPYVVPEGSYFMLGDNRNNSKDSRFWTNKYVSEDKILGKVKFKYYPNISTIE